jgi:hypothetical protein
MMRQTTTAELRSGAGKAARFSTSAQSTSWFARLLHMRCAIYRCPRRPDGQSWPATARNPGNVGLNLWIVGLAVVLLSTLAINGIMTAWDQRTIFALGAWLRLSPWIIGFAATVPLMWNSVIFGGLIFVFAGWRLVDDRPRRTAES